MEFLTYRINVPFRNKEDYYRLTKELYEWKAKWQISIIDAFIATIYNGWSNKTKYLVLKTTQEAIIDLPAEVHYEHIPTLQPVWGVAADIPEKTYTFSDTEKWTIIEGTTHFAPGQKVYPFPRDYTYDKMIFVCGRHKESGKFIRILQPYRRLLNWRVVPITNPIVIFHMRYQNGWIIYNEEGLNSAQTLVDEMNKILANRGIPKPEGN